jgi:hypothetical protein
VLRGYDLQSGIIQGRQPTVIETATIAVFIFKWARGITQHVVPIWEAAVDEKALLLVPSERDRCWAGQLRETWQWIVAEDDRRCSANV